MKVQNHLQLFLAPLIHCVLAFTLTIPEPQNIDLVSFNDSNSEWHCTKGPRFSRQRPSFADCGGAIRQLNSNNINGEFHSKGILNQWQLPVMKWHHTCIVVVEMEPDKKDDQGNWLEVSLAATQLNMVCVGVSPVSKYQGGITHAGLYDGIKVSLKYYPPPKGGLEKNGTAKGHDIGSGDMAVS